MSSGVFGMDVVRRREHKCLVETCSHWNIVATSGQKEAWVMLLAENAHREQATVQELVTHAFADEWLAEGLRCERCGSNKEVLEQTFPLSSPQLLLVGFPRNEHVDRTVGRQHRNEDRIASRSCGSQRIAVRLCGIGRALSKRATQCGGPLCGERWLRCDDAVVTEERCLADTVEKGVVLALYRKSSSQHPRTGGVTAAASELRSVEEARGRKQLAFARQGRVRTLPFAAAGDGTVEFEQHLAACLRG